MALGARGACTSIAKRAPQLLAGVAGLMMQLSREAHAMCGPGGWALALGLLH